MSVPAGGVAALANGAQTHTAAAITATATTIDRILPRTLTGRECDSWRVDRGAPAAIPALGAPLRVRRRSGPRRMNDRHPAGGRAPKCQSFMHGMKH